MSNQTRSHTLSSGCASDTSQGQKAEYLLYKIARPEIGIEQIMKWYERDGRHLLLAGGVLPYHLQAGVGAHDYSTLDFRCLIRFLLSLFPKFLLLRQVFALGFLCLASSALCCLLPSWCPYLLGILWCI